MSKPIKFFIDINIEYSHRLDFHVFPKNEVICFIVTNNMWEVSWADPNKHTLDLVMNWLLLFLRLKSMFWIFCYAGLPSMFSCATMAECNGFNPTKNKNWEQALVIMFLGRSPKLREDILSSIRRHMLGVGERKLGSNSFRNALNILKTQ